MIMTLSMAVGCSSKVKQESDENIEKRIEPVEITIWHDKEEAIAEVLQSMVDPLAPEIVVTLEKKDGLTDALKLVGNDPASAPDMYFFAHDKIGVYAEMDILAPITDFVSEEKLSEYSDRTLEAVTYNDVIYQLPIYYETLLFMYNKALMSESEVPETTEELYAYMKEKTVGGRYGFVEQHSTAYYSAPWIHGFGGQLINQEGEPQLTSEAMLDALTYHLKFLEFMPTESEYSTVNTLFLEGYASATMNGPWLVPSVREAGIDLGFAKMPIVDDTGLPLAPFLGVQGIHVLKVAAEAKSEAIKRVLEQIGNPKLGIEMSKVSGSAPANIKCYEDEEITGNEMIMTMKDTAESAIPMPNIPEMDVMFVITGNLLVAVNMNGKDPKETANDFQGKAKRLIEAMK
jgi:arabinogalactan oligomer/maltooligosaccharide transport system substrate-binding protein